MSAPEDPLFGGGIATFVSLASRLLGWRPAEFWQATPAELAAALREPQPHESSPPPSRELIAQMLERDSNG